MEKLDFKIFEFQLKMGKYCGIFSDLLFIGKVTNNHTFLEPKEK